jgi:outer membrane protein assembly factor BamB
VGSSRSAQLPVRLGIVSLVFIVLTGIGTADAGTPQANVETVATTEKVDWATFGFDTSRSDDNPVETTIGPGNAGQLQQLWSTKLGGALYHQPMLAANVTVGTGTEEVVYQGSEDGLITALNAADGSIIWQRDLHRGSGSCAAMGTSDAPVIDRPTNLLYVAGGDGSVYALDLGTGAIAPGWPIAVATTNEHVWSGLNLVNGVLYVPVAGCNDQPPYRGRIVAVKVASRRSKAWYVVGQTGPSGGGIWGWGGVSVDPVSHDVFAATGNALGPNEHVRFAEHVVRLSAALAVKAANYPGVTGIDVDFGSTPVLYQATGCPAQLAVENKDGELFVYDRDTISSGPFQSIKVTDPHLGYLIGHPAWDPATQTLFVANGSDSPDGTYLHGLLAMKVQPDCTLALAWQQTRGANKYHIPPPMVANGVVYFADFLNPVVYAFDTITGQELWSSAAWTAAGFAASPMLVNGVLYVSEDDGTIHAFGLP